MPLTTLQRFEETLKYLQAAEKNPSLKLSKFFRDAGYNLPVNAKRGDPFYSDYHAISEYVATYKGKHDVLAEKVQSLVASAAAQNTVEEPQPTADDRGSGGSGGNDIRQLFGRLVALNDDQYDRLIRLVVSTRKELASLTTA